MSQLDYSVSGRFRAGRRRVSVRRANGSTFNAQLYYPATATGENTPYDGSEAPYPAISFGHGFLQPPERYRSTLEHLATWGYWVIATESGQELFPNHQRYSEDLRDCLTYLEQQNAEPTSILYQQVATDRFGISGHSMGGGASVLATASDARIRAIATLAAADTNPSAIQQSPNITVPHSLISGSADTITPLANHGQRMYNAGFAPKLLPVIQGGWHCGFQDSSIIGCDSGPMSRATQLQITRRLLTAFFELYLRGDLRAWDDVWGAGVLGDPRIVLSAESGIAVEPDFQRQIAFTPRILTYGLAIANLSRYPQRYQILIEGNRWQTEALPNPTPQVAPGGVVKVQVRVRVPRARPGSSDLAQVSALSLRDGGTRAIARIQTVLR